MRNLIVSLLIVTLIPLSFAFAQEGEEKPLSVGDPMPAFELPWATKDTMSFDGISSEDLTGQRYVVATFPASWSGGCTKEMCAFRDEFDAFEELDVTVLPVSGDYVFASYEWAKHHELPFKVMADATRDFGKKLGVYMPKYGMFQRSVFVVGPDGKLEYVDYEYSVQDSEDFERLKKVLAGK